MAHFSVKPSNDVGRHETLQELINDLSSVLLPPERITVAEAAAKYYTIYNPPTYHGPFRAADVPYLTEVMNTLESRDYSSVCFVAPAQAAKTSVNLAWLAYNVVCDPSDFMIIEKSKEEAKNFSMMKADRMIRHSPLVRERMIQRRTADNIHEKRFKSGTFLMMTWPSVNTLSGKTVRRVSLSDYDRMTQDIGGEGSPFDLARRRTTTYKRLGMTYVESSPSFDVLNPGWRSASPHEAPPTAGILGIYNRGDRRLRYWECPHCREWFEPHFKLLRWPESADPMESAEGVYMACPHCFESRGAIITQAMRLDLDTRGIWLPDGQSIEKGGKVVGKARRSDIASFWLKGPAAAFAQWKTLVINYLLAMEEFVSNGNDRPLKTTINTDQGVPYLPPHVSDVRSAEDLMERGKNLGDRVVPQKVRFLIASVDVQRNRFVVQVHGIVPAPKSFDFVVIDRFEIRKSERLDDDKERFPVNPGSYKEDWDLLTEKVLDRTYPTDEESPRQMAIRLVLCDSGGRAGVTTNSYDYYRKLKGLGYGNRFLLVKGTGDRNAPRVKKAYPDSERKDRKAGARGEIPVLFIQTDMLKDWLNQALGRMEPGGGYIEFPEWLDLSFYQELCAEIKSPDNGRWENPKKLRNESTDLMIYAYAGCIHMKVDKFNWDGDTPRWARVWDENPLVLGDDAGEVSIKPQKQEDDRHERLKKLASDLA